MWQVSPESKIWLVSFELPSKFILGLYLLEDIRAIDAYIFCDSLSSVLFSDVLSICFDLYARVLTFSVFQWTYLSEVSGFGKFAIKWSSKSTSEARIWFPTVTFITLIIIVAWIKGWFLIAFFFYYCLKHSSVRCEHIQWLHLDWAKIAL